MLAELLRLSPPRLRSSPDAEDDLRSATWLELFFDLVFVVAIAELAHVLSADVSIPGVVAFLALFVPTWWAWVGSTFYATRFDTDDVVHRLFTVAEMFAVAALAVSIHDGLAASASFALAYAGVRGVLVLKYLGASHFVPVARPLTRRYAAGFAVAAGLWALSAFVPPPARYALWGVGLLVDFGTPISAGQLHARIPPHAEHLPERFGLFTIIVLGESVLAVVSGVAEVAWTPFSVLAAAFALLVAVSVWWVYFDRHSGVTIDASAREGRVLVYEGWLYAHLPLVVGLTAAGVGVEHALTADLTAPLAAADCWLLCGAVATCLAAIGVVQWTTTTAAHERGRSLAAVRAGGGVLVLLLAPLGRWLPAVALVGTVAILCVAQVGYDLRARLTEVEGSDAAVEP
ncbi:low temperature requirement protein A [Halomarina pelagica]|uniref:low temperature requirement protein A n=1 Tax=Halomarina pelagica TaxID=2961599 RepID=UPI0020C31F9E|nr:low temperature requirement protein A [Halomarina sp. BND7]